MCKTITHGNYTGKQIAETTASILSFKQGVENQNPHLHYLQDTSIDAVTAMEDSLVLT
jgi:hypothetical protein